MAKHNILGEQGEHMAVEYLKKENYKILQRNYRYKKAEVDIIAEKDGVLAVVEVKTRSTLVFGNPEDFVKPKQIKNLVAAVDYYILKNDLDVEVRFDIVAIVKQQQKCRIKHLKNAFYHF